MVNIVQKKETYDAVLVKASVLIYAAQYECPFLLLYKYFLF